MHNIIMTSYIKEEQKNSLATPTLLLYTIWYSDHYVVQAKIIPNMKKMKAELKEICEIELLKDPETTYNVY